MKGRVGVVVLVVVSVLLAYLAGHAGASAVLIPAPGKDALMTIFGVLTFGLTAVTIWRVLALRTVEATSAASPSGHPADHASL